MSEFNKKKKKRGLIIWLVLIGGLLGLIVILVSLGSRKKADGVYVEESSLRTIVSSVTETGTVEPVIEVKIAADVSGEVVSSDVKEGMQVKRGDVLVVIRPDNYQSALEQAQASLNASQASELNAKSSVEQAYQRYLMDSVSFTRQDELFRKKVVSKMEWDAAQLQFDISRSAYKGALANLRSAKYQTESRVASLKSANNDLRKTTIFASMDGTITKQNAKIGERVAGTAQMEGTEIFRLADLSRMQVSVKVNENDIVHVKIGDSAHIELDAYQNKHFHGKVTEIAYSAAASDASADQITSFEVKVEIDRESYIHDASIMRGLKPDQSPFRPGMTAQVEIFTERVDNAVSIPIQAVTIRKTTEDDAVPPKEVVFIVEKDMTVKMVEVETGISGEQYIQILKGLNAGQSVVTGPYRLLSKDLMAGQKVTVLAGKSDDNKDDKENEEQD